MTYRINLKFESTLTLGRRLTSESRLKSKWSRVEV